MENIIAEGMWLIFSAPVTVEFQVLTMQVGHVISTALYLSEMSRKDHSIKALVNQISISLM